MTHKRGASETPWAASVALEDILCEQTTRRGTESRGGIRSRAQSAFETGCSDKPKADNSFVTE